jgi:hypothetical protein
VKEAPKEINEITNKNGLAPKVALANNVEAISANSALSLLSQL